MECPDDVMPIHSLSREEHPEGTIVLSITLGPVSGALELAGLCQVGDHDDGGSAQLPHHPPEVHHCGVQGTWEGRETRDVELER